MQRRTALKLIGLAITGPALIVQEKQLLGKSLTAERMPLGFPRIDLQMKGGLRPGNTLAVAGSKASDLLETLAVRFAQSKASVALVSPKTHREPNSSDALLETQNITFWNFQEQNMDFWDQWRMLTDLHDVVVVDWYGNDLPYEQELRSDELFQISRANHCAVVKKTSPASTWFPRDEDPNNTITVVQNFMTSYDEESIFTHRMFDYVINQRIWLYDHHGLEDIDPFYLLGQVHQLFLDKNRYKEDGCTMEYVSHDHSPNRQFSTIDEPYQKLIENLNGNLTHDPSKRS